MSMPSTKSKVHYIGIRRVDTHWAEQYRAICSCGWTDEETEMKTLAVKRAMKHYEEARRGIPGK